MDESRRQHHQMPWLGDHGTTLELIMPFSFDHGYELPTTLNMASTLLSSGLTFSAHAAWRHRFGPDVW